DYYCFSSDRSSDHWVF
nr:immunoglobulin light chain junction region [Macaca mulatta]MOV73915.1 immunoglobulin light chain junction region [Macaca mulatta]